MNATEEQVVIRPSLGNGSIEIRRYRASFADGLYEAVDESRADLEPWLFWATPEYSPQDAAESAARMEKAWDERTLLPYAVFDAATGRFLGGCGLNSIDPIHRRANLGYWTRASCAGRGIAVQATQLLSRIAFEDFRLIRLEIVIAVENDRSRRVAEKVGAHLEGILKSRLITRDGVHDAYGYSLIAG